MRRGVAISEMAPLQCKTAINRLLCPSDLIHLHVLEVEMNSNRRVLLLLALRIRQMVPIVLYEWPRLVPDARNVSLASSVSPLTSMPVERGPHFGLGFKTSSTCICCRARRLLPVPGVVASKPQFPQPLVFKSPRSEVRFDSCLMQCCDPEPRIHGIPHLWIRSRFVLHCHCR